MLKQIAGPLKARRGQTVHFRIKIDGEKIRQAYCPVFFREAGFDYKPAPHVSVDKLETLSKTPKMVTPTGVSVGTPERFKTLTIVADADGDFFLMHDVDRLNDPTAKGWIWKDGTIKRLFDRARRWFGFRA